MARNYSNIAFDTTLVAGIAAGDLSLVVVSATGWPAVPFAAVLDPGLVTEEVVQVTNKVGTTFTITRGFDGTTAAAHALGATVRHSAIAGDFTDLQAADTAEVSARSIADSALSSAISSEASTRAAADALLTPMARTLTINGVTLDLSANRSWTVSAGSGTVTSVDLTVPGVLFSVSGNPVTTSGTLALSLLTQTANTVLAGPVSGGAASPTMRALVAADIPAISLTAGVSGILPPANGGTGTNNTGNLAWPASGGTAALLGTANVFTQAQTINGANLGIAITGAASGGTPSIVASSPAVAASTAVGTPLQITASPAIAGSTNAGAAVGGNVTITAGAAARLTSGNANGGNINLTPGAGIGTGLAGQVLLQDGVAAAPALAFASEPLLGFYRPFGGYIGIPSSATSNPMLLFGTSLGQFGMPSSGVLTWTASSTTASGASDTAIRRNAAGVIEIGNGVAGQWGSIKAGTRDAGTTTITDGLTLGHQSTGTPAAGLGVGIKFNINSSTTADQNAAQIAATWTDATDASRTSALTFSTVNSAGAVTERMRLTGAGAALLRTTDATQAAGLYVPWITGDALPTAIFGSTAAGDNQVAVHARSGSTYGLHAQSRSSSALRAETVDSTVAALLVVASAVGAPIGLDATLNGNLTTTLASGSIMRHNSSGTPAAGFGARLLTQLKSNTTTNQDASAIDTIWTDATHASRTSAITFSLVNSAAALAERVRIDNGSGAGTTGFLLWDVDNNTLERVTVGIADSGGVGFKLLRIPN